MQQLTRIITNAPIATIPTKQKTDKSLDVLGSSPETEMADRDGLVLVECCRKQDRRSRRLMILSRT